MVTMFNAGESINITIKARVSSISIYESNGKTDIRYDITFDQPGGGYTRKSIKEEDLLKLVNVEMENKDESET